MFVGDDQDIGRCPSAEIARNDRSSLVEIAPDLAKSARSLSNSPTDSGVELDPHSANKTRIFRVRVVRFRPVYYDFDD